MPNSPFLLRLAAAGLLTALTLLRAEDTPASVPASVLKRYDKNKNGTLEAAEVAKWEADKAAARAKHKTERDALLAKYDANHDGRLDEAETADAKLGMEKVRAERIGEKIMARAAAEKAAREPETAAQPSAPIAPATEPAKDKSATPAMTEDGDAMMMK
ncbi:EF-hand domain-containing protein [bacterium]|jgi:hypothetical protein|nr:EF-hand domain-containing protein [bacterium]